jgi:NAD(P)-dependent dehydrogenase (short-subunit alcohol dehydrogenase family)
MSKKLEGKIAVVTGASAGIGLGIAKAFAEEGARVFITGRRQSELDRAVAEIGHGAIGVQGDAGKLADLDALYATIKEQAGRIDVLALNAGFYRRCIAYGYVIGLIFDGKAYRPIPTSRSRNSQVF